MGASLAPSTLRALAYMQQTAEHLTLASLGKSPLQKSQAGAPAGDRQNSQFKEDADVPTMFRARLQDYFRSGYDRGHMYVFIPGCMVVMWRSWMCTATGCRLRTRRAHRCVWTLGDMLFY